MKKLDPVLQLINTILLSQLKVVLSSPSEQALGIEVGLDQIALKAGEAEGLTIDDIQVRLEEVVLPHPDDLNLYATVRVERLDVNIANVFWSRAAKTARQAIVANLGLLLDRVELRDLRIQVAISPAKVIDLDVQLGSCCLKLMGQLMQETTGLHLVVENFDSREKDKKKALAEAKVRLNGLKVRVKEMLLNRAYDVIRERIPAKAKLTSVDIALIEDSMRITAKTGYLPMSIPVEVRFATRDNLFGIQIVKIMVGLARPLVMKVVQMGTANKREITTQGDNIWINPWIKIPIALETRVQQFAVSEGCIVVEFAPAKSQLALPQPG